MRSIFRHSLPPSPVLPLWPGWAWHSAFSCRHDPAWARGWPPVTVAVRRVCKRSLQLGRSFGGLRHKQLCGKVLPSSG
jgi:hypothetical protein